MRNPITYQTYRRRIASGAGGSGDNLRGAMLMCASMVTFTCNDTVMKFVTREMPLYQAITLRGLVVVVLIALIAAREGGLQLRVDRTVRAPMALRIVGEVGSTILFLNALQHMAIGDLSAVMQSLPLAVMLAAAVFFKERLGWRRMGAVIAGLIGVLIILRPGGESFGIWAVVALASMLMIVLRDLATRKFPAAVSSTTIAFHAAVAVTLTGLVMSFGQGWIMPDMGQLLLLGLAGGFLTIGYVTAVSAMRVGEMSYVAPFRYTSLLAAIFLGLVVFGEWPDAWTWAGSALVVGAGVYSILREARLARRADRT